MVCLCHIVQYRTRISFIFYADKIYDCKEGKFMPFLVGWLHVAQTERGYIHTQFYEVFLVEEIPKCNKWSRRRGKMYIILLVRVYIETFLMSLQ